MTPNSVSTKALLKRLTDILANRDLTTAIQLAEQQVRGRLARRPELPIDAVLSRCDLPAASLSGARRLLLQIGETLNINPGTLRSTDHFGELFRVGHSELGSDAAGALARHRVGNPLEVFGFDILHIVETTSSAAQWRVQRAELDPSPSNDDEWVDAIMKMDLSAFLRFFGALVIA